MAIARLINLSLFLSISFTVVFGSGIGIKYDDEYKGEKNPRVGFVIPVDAKIYYMDTAAAARSWSNARRYCEAQSMILAKVLIQKEIEELNKKLPQANTVYWVDGAEAINLVSSTDMKAVVITGNYSFQPTFCLSLQTALPTFSTPPELRSALCTTNYPILCQFKPLE